METSSYEKKARLSGCGLYAIAGLLGISAVIIVSLLITGVNLNDILSGEATDKSPLEIRSIVESGLDEMTENESDNTTTTQEEANDATAVDPPPATETHDTIPANSNEAPANNDNTNDNIDTVNDNEANDNEANDNEANDNSGDDEFIAEEFIDMILGISAKAPAYYSMGSTAGGTSGADPYFFVNPGACGMKVVVRSLPTAAVPGETAVAGLEALYQELYVDYWGDSVTWDVTQPAADIDLYSDPAARMETERVRNNKMTLWQLTFIRGESRSGFIEGQINESCAARPESLAALDEITNSVAIHEPAGVCYVGLLPESDPAEYDVGCDYERTGVTGLGALADAGFTETVLGPTTWEECAAFMKANNQQYWTD